ncbi:P-loop containing nucleoside triphosphatehydrolases superfamily protein [Striga asiatica]|uniref:P-loop containing nucleoside triphosphatehydrolases superfamily protein n=1 Tax=Striga asiatica TaxID=4170 RepID=A0A5A7PCI1_STRAF|nr:P-loop containing nucleoside triphosphatehydrolases superfamily protein [Striga asiatica]
MASRTEALERQKEEIDQFTVQLQLKGDEVVRLSNQMHAKELKFVREAWNPKYEGSQKIEKGGQDRCSGSRLRPDLWNTFSIQHPIGGKITAGSGSGRSGSEKTYRSQYQYGCAQERAIGASQLMVLSAPLSRGEQKALTLIILETMEKKMRYRRLYRPCPPGPLQTVDAAKSKRHQPIMKCSGSNPLLSGRRFRHVDGYTRLDVIDLAIYPLPSLPVGLSSGGLTLLSARRELRERDPKKS